MLAVESPDGWRAARLVEVEAYAETDPASHAFGGPRTRNQVMFGDAAVLYVYFTYGMHWCCNVVTGTAGVGQAVLLRAAEPLVGIEGMQGERGGVPLRDLCRGPARLAQALAITGADNGALIEARGRRGGDAGVGGGGSRRLAVLDDGVPAPGAPGVGPRVGITKAADVPWRWWVPDSPWVSTFRLGARRRRGDPRLR